jgi:hypothetical protein
MNLRSTLIFYFVLVVLTVAGGTALATQWRQSMDLRVAIEGAKSDADELARLRDENLRLRAQQIPRPELERLRADHAALARLRMELEALQHASSPVH